MRIHSATLAIVLFVRMPLCQHIVAFNILLDPTWMLHCAMLQWPFASTWNKTGRGQVPTESQQTWSTTVKSSLLNNEGDRYSTGQQHHWSHGDKARLYPVNRTCSEHSMSGTLVYFEIQVHFSPRSLLTSAFWSNLYKSNWTRQGKAFHFGMLIYLIKFGMEIYLGLVYAQVALHLAWHNEFCMSKSITQLRCWRWQSLRGKASVEMGAVTICFLSYTHTQYPLIMSAKKQKWKSVPQSAFQQKLQLSNSWHVTRWWVYSLDCVQC